MAESLGTERTSTETEQVNLGVKENLDFLQGIVNCLSESEKWQGSAEELGSELGLNATPRSVSVQLKKSKRRIRKFGYFGGMGKKAKQTCCNYH